MKNRVLENRYVVNSIRLVLCVLSIGLLYLSFLSVSYLNRTPYVGFDYQDHPLLTLVDNPPTGLQLGDVLVHINGSRIVGTRSWQEILNSLPRDESIPLTVNRNGRPTNIRLSATQLADTVFAYRPESVALIVTQAPPGSRLKENDRILSISGLGVETGQEDRILNLLADKTAKPLTIVFMHQGSVGVYIADPGSLAELKTRFIHKYPVIITEVNPNAGLPLKPGDQILSINGHPIWNRDSLDHQLNALPFGSSLILYYHSGADYQTTRSNISLSLWDRRYAGNLLYLIVIVLGFILTLFLLFQLRDQLLGYYQSLLMLSIFSLLLTGWKLARPHIPYPSWILLPFIGLLPLSIYLFLNYFPIQLHRLKRLDWPQRLLTGLMIVTVICGIGNWVSLSILTEWSKIVGLILSTLLLAYSLHILLLTRKTYERSSQRLIYIGIILGFLLPFIAFCVEVAMPSTMRSLASSLLILGVLNVPLVVLYSHIRKRVLYTDVIFKKSFSYTIVSGIILFSYFLVVVWMGKHIHTLLKIDNIWIMLIFLLLAAFLVEPLKNIVTRLTDRLFYRTQVGYREYILESSSQLNYLMEISTIIDLVLNKVCDIAYISGGYIALWDEAEERYKCRAARDPEISDFREVAIPPDWQMVAWLMDRREPIELFDHRNYKQFIDLPEAEHKLLERLNVSVIAPFISRNELIGFLMLKRKLSGELYSYEDINFLGILCNQAAIALENALFREKEKALLHSMYQQKRLALMGQMSANIAHEIRNPLVAIKGLGKLVEESFDSADRRKEHMKVLNSEVSRLQNVVSDLVKFARPTSLDIKEVDLNDLLEDIALLYREECRRRGVTFDVIHHGQPVMVPIDGEKIKQALINLVQNSLDAMVNGGQISLEAKIIEHSNFSNIYSTLARIRITDSGPGIPLDLREKVFEPFFTSKKTGTGLGLAIARDIIEEHGGHIRITDSLVEGVTGITFELDFPLQPTLKGGVS